MDDLHHLNKTIMKSQVNADKTRMDAETARLRAFSFGDAGNDGQMTANLAAAEALERKAQEHEEERQRAERAKQSVEAQISELEKQKERAQIDHDAYLTQVTKEIDRLRGTPLSL